MKQLQLYLTGFCLSLTVATCNSAKKPSNMTPITIQNNEIKTSFFASPHPVINIEELKLQLQKHPERWQVAFGFLAKLDMANLPLGRTDLSKDVYANVAEYETKTVDESSYESHKDYIDIQYLISGQQYIAVNKNIPILKVTKPYEGEKDYMNYEYDGQKLLLADQKHFFIFFPTDAHMPCIKVGKKAKVKKLVIKVKHN